MLLWLSVIVGTYVLFPLYRATPPAGAIDLSAGAVWVVIAAIGSADGRPEHGRRHVGRAAA